MKVISILLFFVLCACSSLDEPIEFVSYDGIEMKGTSAKQFDFNLKLTVKNNLWLPVKVKPSLFYIEMDQQKIGQLSFDEKVKMRARKNTNISVPVHFVFEDGAFLKVMAQMTKETANVHFTGDLHTKLLFVSKTVPLSFSKSFSPSTFNPFSIKR
ncbi:MAG: LEA type 2 family protein [Crocinitomicaceae bacterium]|jgi:hypothetical protein